MTRQDKLLNVMMQGWWYHTFDLVKYHYEAPRLLRYLVLEGKLATKMEGKYKLFKKLI